MNEDEIWKKLEPITIECDSYKNVLSKLQSFPIGYSLYFSFHYADADISNGGISQLYANSTWQLVPKAIEACQVVNVKKVEDLLTEMVFYYHIKGRSKLKKAFPRSFFEGSQLGAPRSLSEIEDDYFSCECERQAVIDGLLNNEDLWVK